MTRARSSVEKLGGDYMLYGIDISNNNKGLVLTDTNLLYIMKATEGTSFVDRYCDPWVQ